MKLTLYQRTYPVQDAPLSLSLIPFVSSSRYTFPSGGRVYEATYSEIRLDAPEGAKVDPARNRLIWGGEKGLARSTAKEVFDLALACHSGFRMVK